MFFSQEKLHCFADDHACRGHLDMAPMRYAVTYLQSCNCLYRRAKSQSRRTIQHHVQTRSHRAISYPRPKLSQDAGRRPGRAAGICSKLFLVDLKHVIVLLYVNDVNDVYDVLYFVYIQIRIQFMLCSDKSKQIGW